ncbi:MAG: stage II sporulation protein P [Lachnospiraceae bacterium]
MQWFSGGICILFVFVCYQNMEAEGKVPAVKQIGTYIKEEMSVNAWKNCMMVMLTEEDLTTESLSWKNYILKKLDSVYPICGFSETLTEYDTQIESNLSHGLLAENEQESKKTQSDKKEEEKENEETQENPEGEQSSEEKTGTEKEQSSEEKTGTEKEQSSEEKTNPEETPTNIDVPADSGKVVEISREKLKDFDYLVQNFYQVDRTTTVDSSQLNVDTLLGKSMKLEGSNENVQILIYHTHSQEGYADSTPGDSNTSVVGVAEYLTSLLREKYGFNVMHHTGEYDVKDRDNAYSYAGPALEQILAENPSIEVVIDLHRDGVAETTHLVSEVNGKQTAQIMFFNGLSRTTANGDIPYLQNPYLSDNLALSFQMKLTAEEYYPGFTRSNYLKGYRYNLHYRPKSLLIEVGAQTNTVEEAKNAMEPLADILHKVLSP